jgi:hypothetical protein
MGLCTGMAYSTLLPQTCIKLNEAGGFTARSRCRIGRLEDGEIGEKDHKQRSICVSLLASPVGSEMALILPLTALPF